MQYVTRLLRVLIASCLANYLLVCTAVVPLSGLSAGIVLLALLVSAAKCFALCSKLSLIHISEPTRH